MVNLMFYRNRDHICSLSHCNVFPNQAKEPFIYDKFNAFQSTYVLNGPWLGQHSDVAGGLWLTTGSATFISW